jgi:hypothetical protein
VMARRQYLICCFQPARLPGFSAIAAKPAKRNGHSAATMVRSTAYVNPRRRAERATAFASEPIGAGAIAPAWRAKVPDQSSCRAWSARLAPPLSNDFFERATCGEYVRRVGAHFRMPDQPREAPVASHKPVSGVRSLVSFNESVKTRPDGPTHTPTNAFPCSFRRSSFAAAVLRTSTHRCSQCSATRLTWLNISTIFR